MSSPRPIFPRRRFTPEERLLVGIVRRSVGADERLREINLLRSREGRSNFYQSAQRHGILGLALWGLERDGALAALPDPGRRDLADTLHLLKRQALLWDAERDRLLQLFDRGSFDYVLLKGAALRATHYTDPVERGFGDLDVLVRRNQTKEAIEAVLSAGYRPAWPGVELDALMAHYYHIGLKSRAGFTLEIHWDLTLPDSPYKLSADEFLSCSRLVSRDGAGSLRSPRPEHMILHAAEQAGEGRLWQLKRLVDIHRIVSSPESVDWAYLVHSAIASGLELRAGLSLKLAQLMVGTDLPRSTFRELKLPWPSRTQISLLEPVEIVVTQHADIRGVVDGSLRVWTIRGWLPRAMFLAQLVRRRLSLDPEKEGLRAPRFMKGSWRIVQLVCFNILIVLRAPILLASERGRGSLRFWSRDSFDFHTG